MTLPVQAQPIVDQLLAALKLPSGTRAERVELHMAPDGVTTTVKVQLSYQRVSEKS